MCKSIFLIIIILKFKLQEPKRSHQFSMRNFKLYKNLLRRQKNKIDDYFKTNRLHFKGFRKVRKESSLATKFNLRKLSRDSPSPQKHILSRKSLSNFPSHALILNKLIHTTFVCRRKAGGRASRSVEFSKIQYQPSANATQTSLQSRLAAVYAKCLL